MAGHQKFGEDSIGTLSKINSTVVELSASTITLGGLQYDTTALQCDTLSVGVGSLDAALVIDVSIYYVYAILDSGDIALIASKSASNPIGYTTYKKVGAFYTNFSGAITSTLSRGDNSRAISASKGLITDYNVTTAVNDFLPLDNMLTDSIGDLGNGSSGIKIPEDGYYTVSGNIGLYNHTATGHTSKIRSVNLLNITVNFARIPIANVDFVQNCPAIEVFLQKDDELLINVDSGSDSGYNIRSLSGSGAVTWISMNKKPSNDIDWT